MKKLLIPLIILVILGGVFSAYTLLTKNKLFLKNTQVTQNPPTDAVLDKGTITGKLCFPSEFLPEGSVDAMDSTTRAIYSQVYPGSYNGGKTTYSINLPAGTYFVRYTTKLGENKKIMYGYHTDQCSTGNETSCAAENPRTNKPVIVEKGKLSENIDICDFYYAVEKEPRFNLTNSDGSISASTTTNSEKPIPAVTPATATGLANPASANCTNKGGKLEIVTDEDGGQLGLCTLSKGEVCEEWAYFRNECNFIEDQKQITQALVEKDKINTSQVKVEISKHFGKFASGGIRPFAEGVGGGYFFAAKQNNQWKIVASGNGSILCSDLSPYPDYPKYLIPECIDMKGNPVKR